jgi:hypothetical protein
MMSPAAAAGVSRVLSAAGIEKAIEIHKGWETAGYAVSPREDCVRVEWVASAWPLAEADELVKIAAGLDRCAAALPNYVVERVEREVAYPGEWRQRPVLEVRRA